MSQSIVCPSCGSPSNWPVPWDSGKRKCKSCGTEYTIEEGRTEVTENLPDEHPQPLPPVKKTGRRMDGFDWGLVLFVLAFISFMVYMFYSVEIKPFEKTYVNTVGEYIIPVRACLIEGDQIAVDYGFEKEPPFLRTYAGQRWEISEDDMSRIKEKNSTAGYLWVRCVRPDGSVELNEYGEPFDIYYFYDEIAIPKNGQLIVAEFQSR